MKFELQTIEVGLGETRKLHPVSVACGIGLAYSQNTQGSFTPLHVKSGLSFGGAMETEREVLRLLEVLAPLTDWNQSQENMAFVSVEIGLKIREAYDQVKAESDALLKQLLSSYQAEALETYRQEHNPHIPLSTLVSCAIDNEYLGNEEDEEDEEDTVISPFLAEVYRESLHHDDFHSWYEAFAFILEKVDALKEEVWKQRSAPDEEHGALRTRAVSSDVYMCGRRLLCRLNHWRIISPCSSN